MKSLLLRLPFSFSVRYSNLFTRKIYFALFFVLFFSFFSVGAFANDSIEDNYVGIWHFDEGDGDKTFNAITGKENYGKLEYVGWEEGVSGSAVRIIDGGWSPAFEVDPSGKLLDGLNDNTETLEAWVYINKFPSTATTHLADGDGRLFAIYPDNHLVYRIFNDEWGYVRSSKKLETGKWIYLAGVHNSTHICLWINGIQDGCAPESRNVQSSGKMKFLLSSGGDDIILDEVRLSGKYFDSEYFNRVYREGMTGELGPEWNFLTDKKIEIVEILGKEFLIYNYDYGPAYSSENFAYYAKTLDFFYRVLIDSTGKETTLDLHRTFGSREVVSPKDDISGDVYGFFDLPPLVVNFTKNGVYKVELRRASFNAATYSRFPDMQLNSIIDVWSYERHTGQIGYPWPPSITCSRTTNTNYPYYDRIVFCFEEKISKDENGVERKNVIASSLMQTLEVYEIEINGLENAEENTDAAAINPFSISRGDATESSENSQEDSNPSIPLLFAGATLASAVALTSGSKIRTWITAEGQRMEEARRAAYRQIEINKLRLAAFERDQAIKKIEEEAKIEEENKRKLNEQFQKRTASLQYALANTDRMHTYEQKAKELAQIQKDYSDVLSSDEKSTLASQASWLAKESERFYSSYKEAKALQLSAAEQTTSASNDSEKTEQNANAKKSSSLSPNERVGGLMEKIKQNFNQKSAAVTSKEFDVIESLKKGYTENPWVNITGGFFGFIAQTGYDIGTKSKDPFGFVIGGAIGAVLRVAAALGTLLAVDLPYGVLSAVAIAADSIAHPQNIPRNLVESSSAVLNWFSGGINQVGNDLKDNLIMGSIELVLPARISAGLSNKNLSHTKNSKPINTASDISGSTVKKSKTIKKEPKSPSRKEILQNSKIPQHKHNIELAKIYDSLSDSGKATFDKIFIRSKEHLTAIEFTELIEGLKKVESGAKAGNRGDMRHLQQINKLLDEGYEIIGIEKKYKSGSVEYTADIVYRRGNENVIREVKNTSPAEFLNQKDPPKAIEKWFQEQLFGKKGEKTIYGNKIKEDGIITRLEKLKEAGILEKPVRFELDITEAFGNGPIGNFLIEKLIKKIEERAESGALNGMVIEVINGDKVIKPAPTLTSKNFLSRNSAKAESVIEKNKKSLKHRENIPSDIVGRSLAILERTDTLLVEKIKASGIQHERFGELLFNKIFMSGGLKIGINFNQKFPLATRKLNGEIDLTINPEKVAKMSEEHFKFGIAHEEGQVMKINLRAAGKLAPKKELEKRASSLMEKLQGEGYSTLSEKELLWLIDENLIPDGLRLKNRPDALNGWKENWKAVLESIEDARKFGFNKAEAEKIIPFLAYFKALAPNKSIVKAVDEVVGKLPQQHKSWLEGIFFRMREEMMA